MEFVGSWLVEQEETGCCSAEDRQILCGAKRKRKRNPQEAQRGLSEGLLRWRQLRSENLEQDLSMRSHYFFIDYY